MGKIEQGVFVVTSYANNERAVAQTIQQDISQAIYQLNQEGKRVINIISGPSVQFLMGVNHISYLLWEKDSPKRYYTEEDNNYYSPIHQSQTAEERDSAKESDSSSKPQTNVSPVKKTECKYANKDSNKCDCSSSANYGKECPGLESCNYCDNRAKTSATCLYSSSPSYNYNCGKLPGACKYKNICKKKNPYTNFCLNTESQYYKKACVGYGICSDWK